MEALRRDSSAADHVTGATDDDDDVAATSHDFLSTRYRPTSRQHHERRNLSSSPLCRGQRRNASPHQPPKSVVHSRSESMSPSRSCDARQSLSPSRLAAVGGGSGGQADDQILLTLLRSGGLGRGDQTAAVVLPLVQSAIHRQRLQLGETKASLDGARDEIAGLRKQLESSNNERRRAERDLMRIQEEHDTA